MPDISHCEIAEQLDPVAHVWDLHLHAADLGLLRKKHTHLCLILQPGLIQKENKDKDKVSFMKENPPCG